MARSRAPEPEEHRPGEYPDPRKPWVPRRAGPQVTDRDVDILRWIGRHGIVTPEQVASHFFGRDGGRVGTWAAYRRLRVLATMKLVRRDYTFYRSPQVIRLTRQGAECADIDLQPAHLVLAEVRHALAVVDLTEQLLAEHSSASLETEREIRADRRRQLHDHERQPGRGRIPDAVLHLRNGKAIAVELDLTPKRKRDLETILHAYMQESYDAVWWYVSRRTVARVREIVRENRADDFVTIKAWEGTEA